MQKARSNVTPSRCLLVAKGLHFLLSRLLGVSSTTAGAGQAEVDEKLQARAQVGCLLVPALHDATWCHLNVHVEHAMHRTCFTHRGHLSCMR